MTQNVMKKDERAVLNVSKDTRERFTKYMAALIGLREQMFTQDQAENIALDAAEKALERERELANKFDMTPSHLVAEKEADKKRKVEGLLKQGLKE